MMHLVLLCVGPASCRAGAGEAHERRQLRSLQSQSFKDRVHKLQALGTGAYRNDQPGEITHVMI